MFLDSLDIANRAVQLLGGTQITSPLEDSLRNTELAFAYDKLRRPELRRNVWRFAIRKTVLRAINSYAPATASVGATLNTMVIQPDAWDSETTYLPGSIVADINNQYWMSNQFNNVNNPPGGNNQIWEPYFGPMAVAPYDTSGSTAYYAGELVYIKAPNAPSSAFPNYSIFMSRANGNTAVPNVATPWDNTTPFANGQIVSYSGSNWISQMELNVGNTPNASLPAQWSTGIAYGPSAQVTGSNGFIYTSIGNANLDNDPTLDFPQTYWTNTGTINGWIQQPTWIPTSADTWAPIRATMSALIFSYPIGSGPSSETFSKNVFHLPAGYLRKAPQDPKAGTVSILGAPTGNAFDDWEIEGNFLTSMSPGPIVFRFVADITTVQHMDDLFCEGLASRLAYECCEKLTQSTEKQRNCIANYQKNMGDARAINAIEVGPEEMPVDDWIATRL